MLGVEELLELEESLRKELNENWTAILTRLNRTGQLEDLLALLELEHLLSADTGYQVYKTGKILVIGQSYVKVYVLIAIGKKFGIEKKRFEFYLDFKDAKKFDFRVIQWNPTYSAIMVGPMGHSGISKGEYSSVITAIENEEGYPPVVRLGQNGLKITKSDFAAKIQELKNTGKVA